MVIDLVALEALEEEGPEHDPLKAEKEAFKKEVGEMRDDLSFAEKYALQTINEQIVEKEGLIEVAA